MMWRESGRTRNGVSIDRTLSLCRDVRHDIGEVVKLGSMKGLASSQGGKETKVSDSTSPTNEPRGRGQRRDRRGLFYDSNVDIVPAIVN